MRRLAAICALAGILTSPVVARTRFFCRFTGIEILNCEEQGPLPAAALRTSGCCEHRTFVPLANARINAELQPTLEPVLVFRAVTVVTPLVSAPDGHEAPSPPGVGPPLFVQHRALLI